MALSYLRGRAGLGRGRRTRPRVVSFFSPATGAIEIPDQRSSETLFSSCEEEPMHECPLSIGGSIGPSDVNAASVSRREDIPESLGVWPRLGDPRRSLPVRTSVFLRICSVVCVEVLKPCIEVTVKCSWIARNRTYDQNGTCANLRMLSSLERSCIFKHVVPLILAGTYTAAIWTDNFPIS
uniref:Uncharacterized protein n=1 Tax=Physcomitrium patens TaxID=3218 RepID=A0A7I4E9E4_PHYPA